MPQEDYDEYLKGVNGFARIYSVCAPACVDIIQSEHFGEDHVEPILYMEMHGGDAQYVMEEFRDKTHPRRFMERYTLDPITLRPRSGANEGRIREVSDEIPNAMASYR